jgi:hypothetical protein
LQDSHGWVREAVSQTLQKIDPSSGGRRVHDTKELNGGVQRGRSSTEEFNEDEFNGDALT